ncbi:MAG: hypothetical protein JKY94_10400 [Rhodobacteraceae bacterium]|nr:hypothetical protein [Paracoccaceae bacterium]
MGTKSRKIGETDKQFLADVRELLGKYAGELPAHDMLALSATLTGQIFAMQDQTTMTVRGCWQVIYKNIEAGNVAMQAALDDTAGEAC